MIVLLRLLFNRRRRPVVVHVHHWHHLITADAGDEDRVPFAETPEVLGMSDGLAQRILFEVDHFLENWYEGDDEKPRELAEALLGLRQEDDMITHLVEDTGLAWPGGEG